MADFSFPQIGAVDVVEVYEFYDEPVLFACRDRTELLYLAVLSAETSDDKTWLLTAISARRFAQLRSGKLDLHSAFVDAERGQVFRVRLPRNSGGTPTAEWVTSGDLSAAELPVAGERLAPSDLSLPAPAPAGQVPEAACAETGGDDG